MATENCRTRIWPAAAADGAVARRLAPGNWVDDVRADDKVKVGLAMELVLRVPSYSSLVRWSSMLTETASWTKPNCGSSPNNLAHPASEALAAVVGETKAHKAGLNARFVRNNQGWSNPVRLIEAALMLRGLLVCCFGMGLLGPHSSNATDWPEFLGKNGLARSADQIPTEWNEEKNLLWRLELPGEGSSSPIIVGQRAFVTCYSRNGDRLTRSVVCADKRTGGLLWTKTVPADYREDAYRGYLTEHGYASNSPTSDGQHVFVFFGKGGVHALDMDGNVKWTVDVGQESSNREWGSAASLLLWDDRLIVNAAEECQAILALDKTTGRELWRQEAAMLELSYGTPRLVHAPDGHTRTLDECAG